MMGWDMPVQPPIMIFGGLATLTQLLAQALAPLPLAPLLFSAIAQLLAWAAYIFLQYTILIVQWTAQVPFGSFETPPVDWAPVILTYLLILLTSRLSPRRLAGLVLSHPGWAVGFVACATVLVSTSALAAPDPRTHIQFIATSGGDAIFIRTANGARLLIDGGAEPSALLAHLGEQFPFWDRRLDLLVATNVDGQNLASLNAVLERFTVGQVLEPPAPDAVGVSYKKWRAVLGKQTIPSTEAGAGTHLRVDEVTFDVLYPSPDDASTNVALRLAAGNHVLLVAPTLHQQDLRALTSSDVELASEFAVLPRQFDKDLIDRVKPQTVILFAGRNMREQPSLETPKLLEGVHILRTDERGTIEVIIDGGQVQVQSER